MVLTLDPLPAGKPLTRHKLHLQVRPRLAVVIVNYHQWDHTQALVRQLHRSRALRQHLVEIQIIDNDSTDHPALARLRRCPTVSLQRCRRNLGFARAVNAGVGRTSSDWVLLLNPDMSVAQGFLDRILELTEELTVNDPRTGIVGLSLLDPDGSRQFSVGPFPTLMRTLTGLLLPRRQRKYCPVASQQRQIVDWVTGCCLLVRRHCWEELGGLDERFFLYYEDVDLCRRARAAGWVVCHEPALRAIHHHPLHGREVPPALRVVTRHSLLTYGRKFWPNWQFQILARIIRLEAWARRLWARWRGRPQESELFTALGNITMELARGDENQARQRLNELTRTVAFDEPA